MKRENRLVQTILVGLILCLVSTFLYTRAYSVPKDSVLEDDTATYGAVAEKLLKKRMTVMNDFMYGTIGYDEAINQLKVFEKGQCLAWDLEFMKDLKEHPTAYARVIGLDIQEVKAVQRDQGSFKLALNISWSIEDFETNITEEGVYEVVIGTEEADKYKLLKFDPLL